MALNRVMQGVAPNDLAQRRGRGAKENR